MINLLSIFLLTCPLCMNLVENIDYMRYKLSQEIYEYEMNNIYNHEYWKMIGRVEAYEDIRIKYEIQKRKNKVIEE